MGKIKRIQRRDRKKFSFDELGEEADICTVTEERTGIGLKFQVADVGKILVSVDKLNEAGYDVQMSKKNPMIKNAKTGEVTRLKRKGGQFIMPMWVRKTKEGFHRQE